MLTDSALVNATRLLKNQPDGRSTARHLWAAAANARQFEHWLAEAAKDRPLAYIVGHQPFAGMNLKTDYRALIPRPETEQLFELIVGRVSQAPARILDLGSGSGCLAIALKRRWPATAVFASDISLAALTLAGLNALDHDAAITFIQSDLWSKIPRQKFELIVANLPYVPTGEMATLGSRVKDFEPLIALDGGPDGLSVISKMLEGSGQYLARNGQLFLEIYWTHAVRIKSLVKQFLPDQTVKFLPDLAGRTRFALIYS